MGASSSPTIWTSLRPLRSGLVMYAGRVVEENRSDRFFSGPLHPYSARLLRARPMIENRSRSLAVIPGRPVSAVDSPDGCRFHPRCAYSTLECQTWTPVLTRSTVDGQAADASRRSDRSSATGHQMPNGRDHPRGRGLVEDLQHVVRRRPSPSPQRGRSSVCLIRPEPRRFPGDRR